MLMQLIQSDPRFMDVFKELTGVDLMDMQEKEMKRKDQEQDLKKKRDAEDKVKKEAEEKRKKEEAEAALPVEERVKIQLTKEALALKEQGNAHYKKKEFEEALDFYQQAIDKQPHEITFYSNKAAVLMETKKHDEAIQTIDDGIEKAREQGGIDYVKLSKALQRKGNALCSLKKYDEAIEVYNKALIENNDHGIKMSLQSA